MREVDASRTRRAEAFALWMHAPVPMVTLFKTLDVSNLVRLSRRRGCGFNMLMCWCVGRAASRMEEFYLLPVGEKLMAFDRIAVNTVVDVGEGEIAACDLPFSGDLGQFQRDYRELTGLVRRTRRPYELGDDYMVIGTSALAQYDVDGAVNLYAGVYNNPYLIWGRYRRGLLKTTLPVSFQFHHTQLDGVPAARFLEALQREIRDLRL